MKLLLFYILIFFSLVSAPLCADKPANRALPTSEQFASEELYTTNALQEAHNCIEELEYALEYPRCDQTELQTHTELEYIIAALRLEQHNRFAVYLYSQQPIKSQSIKSRIILRFHARFQKRYPNLYDPNQSLSLQSPTYKTKFRQCAHPQIALHFRKPNLYLIQFFHSIEAEASDNNQNIKTAVQTAIKRFNHNHTQI